MNVIKNEWYFDMSDKTINNKNESKLIISNFHKHKEKYGTVVNV